MCWQGTKDSLLLGQISIPFIVSFCFSREEHAPLMEQRKRDNGLVEEGK
jgi:hypothetical protein